MKECLKCGDCCRTLKLKTPGGLRLKEKDFFRARGIEVGNNYIKLDPFVCPHLTKENLCDIHNKGKPIVCIQWECKKKDDER